LRFEGTNEDNRGNLVQSGTISPLLRSGGYIDALPSAEVRYTTTGDSGIRFAYSRGLARPNFGDLAPYLSLNLAGGVNKSSIGNPDLKATHADNFDLLFEQYLKPLGMIQAGYFYKRIADPIVVVQTGGVTYPGIPQTFIQTQPVNAGSAHVQGFEAAYQQRLSYLPGVLSALGISANYSYTTSQANGIPGRSDQPALLRQAPHTRNISPTYDRGRYRSASDSRTTQPTFFNTTIPMVQLWGSTVPTVMSTCMHTCKSTLRQVFVSQRAFQLSLTV
jgi:TonB-dependent receptor